jgi:hypothetical protein
MMTLQSTEKQQMLIGLRDSGVGIVEPNLLIQYT